MFFLKKIISAIVAVILGVAFGVGGVFLWNTCSEYFTPPKSESIAIKVPSPTIEAEVIPALVETSEDGPVSVEGGSFSLCENADEVSTFEKPIPIVWKAKFGGCVESCYGGVFDVISGDKKYPAFLGYPTRDEEILRKMIDAKSIKEETILKITGKWISIDPAYANTLFGGKCVPIVDIDRIEISS